MESLALAHFFLALFISVLITVKNILAAQTGPSGLISDLVLENPFLGAKPSESTSCLLDPIERQRPSLNLVWARQASDGGTAGRKPTLALATLGVGLKAVLAGCRLHSESSARLLARRTLGTWGLESARPACGGTQESLISLNQLSHLHRRRVF